MLEAPEETYAPAPARRRSRQVDPDPRRAFDDQFAGGLPDTSEESEFDYRRQRDTRYRIRFRGQMLEIPKTLWGRIFSGAGLLVLAGCCVLGLIALRSFFLHDGRFTVASSSFIQTTGNAHLSRAQLLSVFGEDVERNIFRIPLAQRRTELESLPWVQDATVMRLLPNHIRIAVTERTPVAFVRQGSRIGMVDASGVLLDMLPDAPGDPHYSFPVITGISANDPPSIRAARMKIYGDFTSDLDSTGSHISAKLSEVDLSNPEDVKALIPEGPNDVLVHFGDTDFLARYQKFEQHLPEWRTQYPKLASVDMRYERQVVLEMQPGTSTVAAGRTSAALPARTALAPKPSANPALKPVWNAKAGPKSAALQANARPVPAPKGAAAAPAATTSEQWHMVVVKPHTKSVAAHSPNTVKPQHLPQAAPQ